jgi:hypothetical protein
MFTKLGCIVATDIATNFVPTDGRQSLAHEHIR